MRKGYRPQAGGYRGRRKNPKAVAYNLKPNSTFIVHNSSFIVYR
jgi:hypothetical protein